MRKLLAMLAPMMFLVLASSAFADGVEFTATSSVDGSSFTFTFPEPSTLTSLDTFTTATFTEGSLTLTLLPAEVVFFPLGMEGLFNILVTIEGSDKIEFFGPQSYSGSAPPFTLLTGDFPVTGGEVFVAGEETGTLTGGSVTVTGMPEPNGLALLVSGLFAVGTLLRKKQLA